jgi:hypothetical protein
MRKRLDQEKQPLLGPEVLEQTPKLPIYIHNLLTDNLCAEEQEVWKWLRRGAVFFTFGLGAFAGVPWLNSGRLVAEAFDFLPLAYFCYAGLIISYGMSAAWALKKTTDTLLKPKPLYIQELQPKSSRIASFSKNISCHLLGVSTVIPAIYLTISYNDTLVEKIIHSIIAGATSYAFSTLGYYTLLDYISGVIKKLPCREQEPSAQEKYARKIDNLIPYLERNISEINNQLPTTSQHASNIHFHQLVEAIDGNKPDYLSPSTCNALEYILKILFFLSIPTAMAIFRVMTTNAAIRTVVNNDGLGITGTIVVNLPLYALVLFAMNKLCNLLSSKVAMVITRKNTPSTHMGIHYPKTQILAFVLSFVLAGFSALTNGYVAYDQMSKNIFSPAAWVFAVSAFINATIFQSIGSADVANDIVLFRDSYKSDNHNRLRGLLSHLPELSSIVRKVSADDFDQYQTFAMSPGI